MSELIGLGGASLAGYAYLPQIAHLIREQCSAGISRKAFGIWFVASILMTIHALLLPALVFIVLGAIQIIAISTILVFSARYRGMVCPIHALRPAADPASLPPFGDKHSVKSVARDLPIPDSVATRPTEDSASLPRSATRP